MNRNLLRSYETSKQCIIIVILTYVTYITVFTYIQCLHIYFIKIIKTKNILPNIYV